jgi:transmembrane protein 70, mitochondrial
LINSWKIILGTLTPNIKSVKVFSLSTSFAGVIAQPILYDKAAELGSSVPVIVGICGFVGFFTFVTPLLIHLVTKRYVTELHFDPTTNEYIATIINFFLVKKQIKFKVEDVHVPEVPGMFTSFIVNHKGSNPASLFVDPKLFDDPYHYVKLMGFDKPMDFKLNLPAEDSKKK